MNREDFDSPPINWVVVSCTLLLFSVVGVFLLIGPAVVASYHPNAPASPWMQALIAICFSSVIVNALLAVLALALRRKAPKRLAKVAKAIYLCFLAFSVALLLSARFSIPDTIVHSVGDTRYAVPSEFLSSRGAGGKGLVLRMCVEDLTGIYDKREEDCDIGTATLYELTSGQPIVERTYAHFFEKIDEFDIEGNRVVFNEGSDEYKALSQDGFDTYAIDELWLGRGPEALNGASWNYNIPTYLQVNDQDELTRFVGCSRSNGGKNSECSHIASTNVGRLEYPLQGPSALDVSYWHEKEEEIVDLISQWEIR